MEDSSIKFSPLRSQQQLRRKFTPLTLVRRFISDWLHHRGSVLLLIVLWPIAVVMIVIAHFQRFWLIGSLHLNLSHKVSVLDKDVMDLILSQSGSELSKKIRDPADPLTSVQLVTACIRQIKRTNDYINAVVATRFEQALEEAKAIDAAIASGRQPADRFVFYGVPFLVKECFEVEGLPYTAGIVGREGIIGAATSPAIQQVVDSGGIIIASTNVSEGCMWHESFNMIYGRTNNPYDFGRTAGGSSGGCGAGVASCMTPIAVTSDVGGSTRIPAFYNGLFGHKPTGGAISNLNTYPDVGNGGVKNFCQLGAISRHADDIWPLINLLARPTGGAGNDGRGHVDVSVINKFGDLSAVDNVDFNSMTVYYSKENLGHHLLLSKLQDEISIGIGRCSDYLASLGATVEIFSAVPEIFDGLNAFQYWSSLMTAEKKESFSVTIREGSPPFSSKFNMLLETIKSVFDLSSHTFPAMLLSLAEIIVGLAPPSVTTGLCAQARLVKTLLHEALRGNKVLILPSIPTSAPLHSESILRIFDTSNTSLFNVMELPVTAVPIGLDLNGLPIGVQVVAGFGNDHLTIAVAKQLQRANIAKWQPPYFANL